MQFVYPLASDSNLVLFHLWEKKKFFPMRKSWTISLGTILWTFAIGRNHLSLFWRASCKLSSFKCHNLTETKFKGINKKNNIEGYILLCRSSRDIIKGVSEKK